MDLSLILEELRALRSEVQALHLVQNIPTDVPKCKGVTGKGTDCRTRFRLVHNGKSGGAKKIRYDYTCCAM